MLRTIVNKLLIVYALLLYTTTVWGETAANSTRRRRTSVTSAPSVDASLGGLADNLTGIFSYLALFLHFGSFMIGIVFTVGSFIKFKQHKDNPVAIPISFPIVLLIFGIIFLTMPIVTALQGYDFLPQGIFFI